MRHIEMGLVTALLLTTLPGCDSSPTSSVDAQAEEVTTPPVTVMKTQEPGISRLTLNNQAVKRLGIEVVDAKALAGGGLELPYGALLYDASGNEWVYLNPQPMVFKRIAVQVERIDGDKMYLSKGPAAGTKVVSVGAAELFGAEFEVGH